MHSKNPRHLSILFDRFLDAGIVFSTHHQQDLYRQNTLPGFFDGRQDKYIIKMLYLRLPSNRYA